MKSRGLCGSIGVEFVELKVCVVKERLVWPDRRGVVVDEHSTFGIDLIDLDDCLGNGFGLTTFNVFLGLFVWSDSTNFGVNGLFESFFGLCHIIKP